MKIGIDMRMIGQKVKRKRTPKRRAPRVPLPTKTSQLPHEVRKAGWRVKHAPKGQKRWADHLGSVLKCPRCQSPFIKGLCKVRTQEKAYWEAERKRRSTDHIYECAACQ